MLVITGATGHVGSKIAELLLAWNQKVRVVGRSIERLAGPAKQGAEPVAGDLGDPVFLTRVFSGADAVFVMIPPNYAAKDFRLYQRTVSESIVTAVEKSGVRYVVDLSSQGAHLPAGTGPIAGLHEHEERLNRLEGVNVLHLRPTYFMENLLMNIDLIRKAGIMGSAVRGDVRFAMIATKDIADFAAERMARRDFTGKTVRDLLGPRDVSLDEAAAAVGAKLGTPGLAYVTFPYEEAEKSMVAMGLTPDLSRLYVEMSRALNDGRFAVGITRTPENTTPTSIEEFAGLFAQIYHAAVGGKQQAA